MDGVRGKTRVRDLRVAPPTDLRLHCMNDFTTCSDQTVSL